MAEVNQRVALRRGGWEGRVTRVDSGVVHVAFDNGGAGIFTEPELRVLVGEDKAWPPAGLETKGGPW